jgi:ATP-dependent helicase HepA
MDQKRQAVLLETVFILECMAPSHLDLGRYLTCNPIHLVVDHEGRDITEKFDAGKGKILMEDQKNRFKEFESMGRVILPSMMEAAQALAQRLSLDIMEKTKIKIEQMLGQEIERLLELQKINPDIRESEITAVRQQLASLLKHVQSARPRLDALRLIRVQ